MPPRPLTLLTINALIRIAAAASGQLFAFLLAARFSSRTSVGAHLVGLLAACFYITELLGAPWFGRLGDRRGYWRVLRYGPAFGIACGVVAAVAAQSTTSLLWTTTILVIARTLEGLSAASAVPATLALLARATEGRPHDRTRWMGLFELTSLLSMIVGYAVSGYAWDALHATSFVLLPVLYAIAFGLLLQQRNDAPAIVATQVSVLSTLRPWIRTRGNLAFGVGWLCVNAVVGLWLQQAPYLFALPQRSPTQTLVGGYSGRQIAWMFSGWGLSFLLGLVLWSVVGARWNRRRSMLAGLLGLFTVCGVLFAINHGGPAWLLVPFVLLVLVESGFTPAALSHLADITERDPAARGALLGLYSLMLGSGQLLGSVLGAPVAARAQMDGVLALSAMLAVIALGCVWRVPDRNKS